MKIPKLNRRLYVIIAISVALSIVLAFYTYSFIEKKAAPEERVQILVFSHGMNENTVLTSDTVKGNVKKISIPISLKPKNAITSIEAIYDMTLSENVRKDEYVLLDMLTERGHSTFNAEEYYQVSIDVSELTNFLGLQLKRGSEYELYYRNKEKDKLTYERGYGLISKKVFIVDLVDHLGNKVFEERDENIKAVIVAMEDSQAIDEVVKIKEDVYFELIKAPVIEKKALVYNGIVIDSNAFIDELMKEKLKGGSNNGNNFD